MAELFGIRSSPRHVDLYVIIDNYFIEAEWYRANGTRYKIRMGGSGRGKYSNIINACGTLTFYPFPARTRNG